MTHGLDAADLVFSEGLLPEGQVVLFLHPHRVESRRRSIRLSESPFMRSLLACPVTSHGQRFSHDVLCVVVLKSHSAFLCKRLLQNLSIPPLHFAPESLVPEGMSDVLKLTCSL